MSTAHVDIEFIRTKPSGSVRILRRTISCVRAKLTLRSSPGAPVVQGTSGRLYVAGPTKIKFHFPRVSPYRPEGIEFDQVQGSNDRRGEANFPRPERITDSSASPRWIQVRDTHEDWSKWDYFIIMTATNGSPGLFVIDPDIENTDVLPFLQWCQVAVWQAAAKRKK